MVVREQNGSGLKWRRNRVHGGQVHETSKDNKQNSFLPSIQPGVLLLADKDNSLPCEPNPIGDNGKYFQI